MKRRTVATITKYLQPKQIYQLINQAGWPYAWNKEMMQTRDRALMSIAFVSGGRITPIVGGPRWIVLNECLEQGCEGEVSKVRVKDSFRWVCDKCKKDYGATKPNEIGKLIQEGEYTGLTRANVEVTKKAIKIIDMRVAKRSRKLIERRGPQVTMRDPFIVPLRRGLFKSNFGDQFVPFGWLILEYLKKCMHAKNPDAPLFLFKRGRAWQIVREVTDLYPNWFRAQSEHFWGHYLWQDSVRLAKFLGVVRPEQIGHYVGSSFESLLKDTEISMGFKWIEKEVEKIKSRL